MRVIAARVFAGWAAVLAVLAGSPAARPADDDPFGDANKAKAVAKASAPAAPPAAAKEADALPWRHTLRQGLDEALKDKKLVFVDFTGVTCLNCKINERTVFTKPSVRELLSRHALVRLYTDKVPDGEYLPEEAAKFNGNTDRQKADAAANQKFQQEHFGTSELPLYVVLRPLPGGKFEEVARYTEGRISDVAAFEQFLRGPGVKPGPPAKPDKTEDLLRLEASVEPKEARPGETVRLTVKGTPKEGYHTYPLTRRTPTQDEAGLSQVTFGPSAQLRPLWPVAESEPEAKDEGGELGVWWEHARPFTWSQDVLVLPDAKPGPATLRATLKVQVCATFCVWGTRTLEIPVRVAEGPPVPLTPELERRSREGPPAPAVVPGRAAADSAAPPAAAATPPGGAAAGTPAPAGGSGLLAFVLQGVFWGAVSLLTPCVFPMIPITVSFFLKQSEKQHHRAFTLAVVYCATIVVVLTVSAVALLSLFTKISTHPLTNFSLGALFIFFALSLFGMYDIELPGGLARFTSSREGRGGLVGTMFMALTFTIISFACVAPFLGGFSGTAAGSGIGWAHRVLGGLAFAATFASPFFVLALFPSLLKKMPKSGTWLNSVKVVMGFLELAAALKFLRAGELVLRDTPTLFTYDFVLGLYVALCLLCGLYLLNLYRLPHDTPLDHLGVPRLLFSLAFLGLGFYLLPALFKTGERGTNQRPAGVVFAWLDSFLLPEAAPDAGPALAAGPAASGPAGGEFAWRGTLRSGLDEAAKEKGKLVFVDFTGKTCTNCSWNERNVFSRPEVRELLGRYSLVQLYTDVVPNRLYPPEESARFNGTVAQQRADADANRDYQNATFGTSQLPLYLILRPKADGGFEEIARYEEGKINSVPAFTEFLRRPLGGARVAARPASGG